VPSPLPWPLPSPAQRERGGEEEGGFAAGGFAARRKTPFLKSPLSPGRKAKGRGGIKGGEGFIKAGERRKCQP